MRRYSLKTSLLILTVACVLPTAGISVWLLHSNIEFRRTQAEQSTLLLARQVVADLENELAAIESALKVLAAAPELQRGDLAGFHKRAKDALVAGSAYNYIITNRQGHQVLNTLVPMGSVLPTTGTPPELMQVFEADRTVLTNLFLGPVTRRPAIAMGVPVRIEGEVRYSLNIGLAPERINQLLQRQSLPDGWLVAVLDRSGAIIGRSRDADRYVGEKGVPALREALDRQTEQALRIPTKEGIASFAAFKPSQRWGWGVAVGLHESTLYYGVRTMIVQVLLSTALALGIGLLSALWLARRVLATVRDVNNAAKALSAGKPFDMPRIQFLEVEAVGVALGQASQAMEEATFRSQHDVLTRLPNRAMFRDFAERQLGLAERRGQGLAVIAIDLDHFKNVNDNEGHAAGDEVLMEAALRIARAVRSSDMAARLGGDEFIVLLSQTDSDAAMQTATRIVEALGQPYAATSQSVTGSAGVALYPRNGTTLDALIVAADKALYSAKSAGRARMKTVSQDL